MKVQRQVDISKSIQSCTARNSVNGALTPSEGPAYGWDASGNSRPSSNTNTVNVGTLRGRSSEVVETVRNS